MPVCGSGVILLPNTVPNGVGTATPPAQAAPSCVLWQAAQLPIAASCAPRSIAAGSNAARGGAATGDIVGCDDNAATTMAAAATTTSTMTASDAIQTRCRMAGSSVAGGAAHRMMLAIGMPAAGPPGQRTGVARHATCWATSNRPLLTASGSASARRRRIRPSNGFGALRTMCGSAASRYRRRRSFDWRNSRC